VGLISGSYPPFSSRSLRSQRIRDIRPAIERALKFVQEIRDRGLLYLKLERFSEAIDDLETYLRLAPDTADAEEILEQLTGRQISTISSHLGKLRALDVVRYDTRGKETRYWLKHKSEMRGLLKMMERVVEASANMG